MNTSVANPMEPSGGSAEEQSHPYASTRAQVSERQGSECYSYSIAQKKSKINKMNLRNVSQRFERKLVGLHKEIDGKKWFKAF